MDNGNQNSISYALFTTITVKAFYHIQKRQTTGKLEVTLPLEIDYTNNLQFQISFHDIENSFVYIGLHRQNEHVEQKSTA